MVEESKVGKERSYIKWKPTKNKLTKEIQRKKSSGKRKSLSSDLSEEKRAVKVDTAMTAVSAGPGKSASQIFFYDWSDNYRRVIKEIKAQKAREEMDNASNISASSGPSENGEKKAES